MTLQVRYHKSFKKDYKKLSNNVQDIFNDKILKFLKNPQDAIFKDHALNGPLKGYRAFSIMGDMRVIYLHHDQNLIGLVRIGTHNQVY